MEANFMVPPGGKTPKQKTIRQPEKVIKKSIDGYKYLYLCKGISNLIEYQIVRVMFIQENGVDFVEIQRVKGSRLEEKIPLTYYVSKDELIKIEENFLQKLGRYLKWS